MKKKIFRLVLLICLSTACIFALAGCDGSFVDMLMGKNKENDVPYNLTIKTTLNGQDFDLPSTVTISGAGVYCVQDRVDLSAPSIPKYQFVGWYDDNKQLLSVLHDFLWNMYDRNSYVEARYVPLEYSITYVVDANGSQTHAQHNCLEDSNVLADPSPIEHYNFVRWFYYFEGKEITLTELPEDENMLMGDQISIFAEHSKEQYTITLNYDATVTSVTVTDKYSEPITITDNKFTVDFDFEVLHFSATAADDYSIDSWTVNDGQTTYGLYYDLYSLSGNSTITISTKSLL